MGTLHFEALREAPLDLQLVLMPVSAASKTQAQGSMAETAGDSRLVWYELDVRRGTGRFCK